MTVLCDEDHGGHLGKRSKELVPGRRTQQDGSLARRGLAVSKASCLTVRGFWMCVGFHVWKNQSPLSSWSRWNPHHDSAVSTSSAVASDVIDNPKRNVPLATMIGLVIAGILYIATCTVLMGIMPAEELAKSSAPFADAAAKVIGPAGADVIAFCAIFKAGSSLVGWTLTISQSAAAAANDGLFPKIFGRLDARGIPSFNFLLTRILMTLIVVATASPTLARRIRTHDRGVSEEGRLRS